MAKVDRCLLPSNPHPPPPVRLSRLRADRGDSSPINLLGVQKTKSTEQRYVALSNGKNEDFLSFLGIGALVFTFRAHNVREGKLRVSLQKNASTLCCLAFSSFSSSVLLSSPPTRGLTTTILSFLPRPPCPWRRRKANRRREMWEQRAAVCGQGMN